MKKDELRGLLQRGAMMDDLFQFSQGQECVIFKAMEFDTGDEIIYIPDLDLNQIVTDEPVEDTEEIERIIGHCYTGDDFICECDGNLELARDLFWYCDWQHPSSALPELEYEY